MVRADHEDGGALNPDDPDALRPDDPDALNPDDPGADRPDTVESDAADSGKPSADKPAVTGAVKRTSPLSRRSKGGRGPRGPVGGAADGDPSAESESVAAESDTAESDTGAVAVAKSKRDSAADDSDSVGADTAEKSAGYRERRRGSVKKPVRRTATAGGAHGAGRLLAWAGAALVLVAAIVVTVVFAVKSHSIDEDRALRAEYDQFAQEVVVRMTTLSADNADKMLDFVNNQTSGRAQQTMRESMKQAAQMIREDKMKTKTTVVASAVEKSAEDEGSVLVVFVWEARAPESPNEPQIETFRSRIDITRINGQPKMTNFEWVN